MSKQGKMRQVLALCFAAICVLSACNASSLPRHDEQRALGPQVNYTITGIDAGAGIMSGTQRVLRQYGLAKNNWQLQTSSIAAMTAQLGKAIKNKQAIVVTGWTPHWMFTKYDLKFLKDPRNVYGSSEDIHTIGRQNLRRDLPSAYTVLDRFYWTPAQMSVVMLKVNARASPRKAAQRWLTEHPDHLKKWTAGVPHVRGKTIKMTCVAWDSEIASTYVAAEALRKVGYKPTLQAMEMQPLWASVATGTADAMTCAWLPNTSIVYYRQYRHKIIDMGTNLKGAQVGLAVPTYMHDVNSIEDLKH